MNLFKKYKRKILLCLIDVSIYTAIFALYYLSTQLVTSFTFFYETLLTHVLNYMIFVVTLLVTHVVLHTYSNVWRYANSRAYLELVFAHFVGGTVAYFLSALVPHAYISVWKCVTVVASSCLLSLTIRFIYQLKQKHLSGAVTPDEPEKKKIAILGAGRIGSLLAEELIYYKGSKYLPVFFIDSDIVKVGGRVAGLPVYSEGERSIEKIRELGITEIIVAVTELSVDDAKRIFDCYSETGCKIKIYDFPTRDADADEKRVIREFKIEDLLFRDAISLVDDETKAFYSGKVILVTGGGGSIGSELCRQIARCEPKQLVIFDIYENNAYEIQQELSRKYGSALNLAVEIGSVRDVKRLDALFAHYRPEIVFHAAAHKHVPLMERSNAEAVKNNVFGTYNTANAAEKNGVKKFILISTDKAVNPTNVMGATKRMCEHIVRCRNDGATVFSAVRFGNVLGSNGSVIPLFKRQIDAGGPVTITDKRIVRYFMTIPEASGLVMQAGAMAKRGELFVLDMGKPVKIYDLAVNMIRFCGLEPYKDIEIKEIGLRPGEKLYEELLVDRNNMQKTDNDLIFIEREIPLTRAEVDTRLALLRTAVAESESEMYSTAVTAALHIAVPTFVDPDDVNRNASEASEMKATATVG